MSGPGRYFVFLTVAALLFCHGTFGYAHQLSPVGVQATHAAHAAHGGHAAGDHGPGQDGDVEGSHLGGAYFATLLLLLFGAALLIGRWVSADVKLPAPRLRVGREGWRLRPPRGPTLSRLQVFRL